MNMHGKSDDRNSCCFLNDGLQCNTKNDPDYFSSI